MLKRFILFLIAFYATSQMCKQQTDSFAVAKISTILLEDPASAIEKGALDQSYRYLGKGGQSYIFVSEDGKSVLKLFRSSRLNTLQFLYKLLPLNGIKDKIDSQENLIRQAVQSYKIAYQHLKDETGLIAVHLDGNTAVQAPLKIVDRLGIVHSLDPNKYPFVIQEKAIPLKDKIDELMRSGDHPAARLAISNLFSLIHARIEKGIADGDPNLCKNFGFCNEKPIQIDGGRFSLSSRSEFLPAFEKTSKQALFRQWIDQHYPELSAQFDLVYEEFVHEAF